MNAASLLEAPEVTLRFFLSTMRILLLGATGTIGQAILEALTPKHEVLAASRTKSPFQVDLSEPESIRSLLAALPSLDAIVSAAGAARFKPLLSLTDEDFAFSLNNKLMGQVNLIRYGLPTLKDGGSITVTTGLLAQHPMVGSGAVSLVNAALEGFVRSAALEAPRGIRVNAVSPPLVRTAKEIAAITTSTGLPADAVAQAYVSILEGSDSGQIISP